jgi:hypothetical protein
LGRNLPLIINCAVASTFLPSHCTHTLHRQYNIYAHNMMPRLIKFCTTAPYLQQRLLQHRSASRVIKCRTASCLLGRPMASWLIATNL